MAASRAKKNKNLVILVISVCDRWDGVGLFVECVVDEFVEMITSTNYGCVACVVSLGGTGV